jgi:hypothetical protein
MRREAFDSVSNGWNRCSAIALISASRTQVSSPNASAI